MPSGPTLSVKRAPIKSILAEIQGRANHEVQTVNWNTGIWEAESA